MLDDLPGGSVVDMGEGKSNVPSPSRKPLLVIPDLSASVLLTLRFFAPREEVGSPAIPNGCGGRETQVTCPCRTPVEWVI